MFEGGSRWSHDDKEEAMDMRSVIPQFPEGVGVDELTLVREGQGFRLSCLVVPSTPDLLGKMAKPEKKKPGRKPGRPPGRPKTRGRKPGSRNGEMPQTSDSGRVSRAKIDTLLAWVRTRPNGEATSKEMAVHFGWTSATVTHAVRTLRVEDRLRLIGREGNTLRYGVMPSAELALTQEGADDGNSD